MPFFTIFDPTTGRIHASIEVPSLADAVSNAPAGMSIAAGGYDADLYYMDPDGLPILRPAIPNPSKPEVNLLEWVDPPPGLHAKVYDIWTNPPTLLVDADLTPARAGLRFVELQTVYRFEMTADFPFRPSTFERDI